MGTRIEKIKTHLSDHKVTYLVSAGTLIVGTVVGALVFGNGVETAQKVTQIVIGNRINATVVNLVERSTPSKPVHLVGTNLYFSSLNEAARITGHSLSQISRQINGHIPDVKGDVFKILEQVS